MRVLALLSCLLIGTSAVAEQNTWNPQSTWVFAVGILKFKGAAMHGWPEKGRMDVEMLQALKNRGVPEDHIVFLKNEQATAAELRKAFPEFVKQCGPNDTLIFYYAGHGGRNYKDSTRPVSFVPYDSENSWPTKTVLDTIVSDFKGSRVLLTADCCHSGGLAEEAQRHAGRINFGTLTSARSSATSTGNWTFTQCLTDLYKGNAALDLDHDGSITFAEAGQFADLRMAFDENQRSTIEVTGSFPKELVMAKVSGPASKTVLDGCEGQDKGKWYKTNILSAKDGRYFVTWPGWDSSYDSWLPPESLRPAGRDLLPVGSKVEIEWSGTWYPGKVLKSELGLLLVHYDGYTSADHEWVPMKRVRIAK